MGLRADSNFLRHRLRGEDATATRPMRVGFTKDRFTLTIAPSHEQLGEIDNLYAFPAQLVTELFQIRSGIVAIQWQLRNNFLRIDRCFRRYRREQQLNPTLL